MPQILIARPIGIMRDRKYLRKARLPWRKRVDLELTEPTPKCEVLLSSDVLIAKEEDLPVE